MEIALKSVIICEFSIERFEPMNITDMTHRFAYNTKIHKSNVIAITSKQAIRDIRLSLFSSILD